MRGECDDETLCGHTCIATQRRQVDNGTHHAITSACRVPFFRSSWVVLPHLSPTASSDRHQAHNNHFHHHTRPKPVTIWMSERGFDGDKYTHRNADGPLDIIPTGNTRSPFALVKQPSETRSYETTFTDVGFDTH